MLFFFYLVYYIYFQYTSNAYTRDQGAKFTRISIEKCNNSQWLNFGHEDLVQPTYNLKRPNEIKKNIRYTIDQKRPITRLIKATGSVLQPEFLCYRLKDPVSRQVCCNGWYGPDCEFREYN